MKLQTLLVLLLLLFFSTAVEAKKDKATKKDKNHEFAVVPYFNYSTTVGFGLGIVPMYSFHMHKEDSISPKSNIGLVGVYNTSGGYAALTYGSLFFSEDKWRIRYALGLNSKEFQTFISTPGGEGQFFDYNTLGNFLSFDIKRRAFEKIFFGAGFSYFSYDTKVSAVDLDSTTNLSILSLDAYRDHRSNVYYPRSGSLFSLKYNLIPTFLGNETSSSALIFNYNIYKSIAGERDVFAVRLHTKSGLGDIQFQQQAVIGGTDLRGYTNGKYRGDGVMDIQAEYRWNFPNPYYLSVVGFGGFGTLYGSQNQDFDWKLYPSIGAGVRYTALKSNHMNVGIDLGFGKEDWGVYFRLSEAF